MSEKRVSTAVEGICRMCHPDGNYRNNNRNYQCYYAIEIQELTIAGRVDTSTMNVLKRIMDKNTERRKHTV